jgi:phage terminase large subunit GpA-like protein
MPFDAERFRVRSLARSCEARAEVADILLPPPDIDVAEAAELYRILNNPQGYSGPWRHAVAPQLIRPMQALTDIRYDTVVFVAPAQSGKTEIGLNFCAHSVRVDPADFQIVLPEKQQAEDFSERRLGRMVEGSPEIGDRQRSRSKFMAVFDQCIVNLSWPTSANASSKPVPRNWLDERDSMDDDIDGEGDPVALYHKRSQTFGPRRKTLVTSSPKRPRVKGSPKPAGAHEAVTTKGVLALYNEGTRRYMYWPCRECGAFFHTRSHDLQHRDDARASDERIDVWFACPHCSAVHGEEDRHALFARHEWLAEGETIDAHGAISGAPRVTTIDSYRLFGPQASFITLEELVRKKLKAQEVREKTGSDTELRTHANVDDGEVYEPEDDGEALSPDELRAVAPDLPLGQVPAWAPLLVATIDVQGDRFEVMWTAFGPGLEGAVIDHTRIIAIRADGTAVTIGKGSGGADSAADLEACDPASSAEHWRALVGAVYERPLRLENDPAKGLLPAMVAIDTGGKAGATERAYAFARWLRRHRPDLHKRTMFIKGTDTPNPMRVWRAQWDPKVEARPVSGERRSRRVINRSGVELYLLAVNLLKDGVANALRRAIKLKGARAEGALHVSRNLPPAIFDQLCAESRDEDGAWENERKVANEGWDLAVYARAAVIRLGGERINWQRPPSFAVAEKRAVAIPSPAAPPAPSVPAAPRRRRSFFRAFGRL